MNQNNNAKGDALEGDPGTITSDNDLQTNLDMDGTQDEEADDRIRRSSSSNGAERGEDTGTQSDADYDVTDMVVDDSMAKDSNNVSEDNNQASRAAAAVDEEESTTKDETKQPINLPAAVYENNQTTDGANDESAEDATTITDRTSIGVIPTSTDHTSFDGSGPISLSHGAYHVAGPGFRGSGNRTAGPSGFLPGENVAANDGNNNENNINQEDVMPNDEEIIFEGYVPEPTPEEMAEEMMRTAITLDESAIRTIPMEDNNTHTSVENANVDGTTDEEEGGSSSNNVNGTRKSPEEGGAAFQRCLKSPASLILLTVSLLSAIAALGVAFGGSSKKNGEQQPQPTVDSSCPENVQGRYNHAKSIVLGITSPETLDNTSSPQNKALEWIVCEDVLSSKLIDDRDPSTGELPKQVHGTALGGNSGESQVLRRYSLATFFYATSEHGPWGEQWNFLSPNVHECSWHRNYTRKNWPFEDFDPAGLVCQYPGPAAFGESPRIMLGDAETEIGKMTLNFRIPNNLSGILPPEFGHIEGLTDIMLETQDSLYGNIPSTIGNLVSLRAIAILFSGPDFGGVIPSSLFTVPALEWISFLHNKGDWQFPASIDLKQQCNIIGISMKSTRIGGTLPSFLSACTSLKELDFTSNFLQDTIPDYIGTLSSLEYVSFHDNNLTGTLPLSLGELVSATALVFGRNNFRGFLPQSLGKLDKLRLLDLSYNNLEGPIPTDFSRMRSLEHISLQHNANLNGSISAFEPLNSLSSLLLYSNNFSSTIPEKLFSNFTGTGKIYADFGHNGFTGKLPQTFSQHSKNTSYIAIMKNNFDADAVDDVICDDVRILLADCSSCPCCKSCCGQDGADEKYHVCNFDLDFFELTGLECGAWWSASCRAAYDPLPKD